jgi:nucleolar protein 9
LEAIVEFAPGKTFKNLYRSFFKERMGTLARNEIAGYVVSKILERLSKEDLEEAMESIMPQIQNLVERNRTSVIKTLIERCDARGADTSGIARQLNTAYGGPHGLDIARLLKLGESLSEDSATPERPSHPQPERVHGSLLAQAMVVVPGQLSSLIFDSFARLGPSLSLKVSQDPTASRALQAALTSPQASIIFQRKVIQQFYGHLGEMALHPSASRVVDAIWTGTQGLAFIRERVAEELAENEASMRNSFAGRAVWKNWKMDLYKRRRADWVKMSRANADSEAFVPFPETEGHTKQKTPLDLARERHVAGRARREKAMNKASKAARHKLKAETDPSAAGAEIAPP